MTDQAANTRADAIWHAPGFSYLENAFSNDVVSTKIVAQCDVLTLGRMQRVSKPCANMITRIGVTRLRFYGCHKWLTLNYNDFCIPDRAVSGGASLGLPADVRVAIDNIRAWMQQWAVAP